MLLAVNYSPQAAILADRGEVEIDLFKCPPWPEVIRAAGRRRPVFVHFDAFAGQGRPRPDELEEMASLVEATGTRYLNTHLAPPPAPAGAASDLERTLEQVLPDVERLAGRFGSERVAVENVPWERRPDYAIDRLAAFPELMRRVLEASGARLILDLTHARFAGEELGMDPRELITPLPLERLVELHTTGLGHDRDGRRRDSMAMTGEDWSLLAWALERIADQRWGRPWALVLEYGGVGPLFEWRSSEAVLARQLPRLAALLAEAGLR